MKDERRSIFRDKALRNYLEGKKAAVLPRLVSPSKLNLLWALLGLFVVVGVGGFYFSSIPPYAYGSDRASERGVDSARRNVGVVVSLPEHTPNLRVGQKLTLKAHPDGKAMDALIVAVEPKVADAATKRLVPAGGDVPLADGSPTIVRPEVALEGFDVSRAEGQSLGTEAGKGRTPRSVLLPPGDQGSGGGG